MDKILTVFTPTYNRAHTLIRTYESFCNQTCKDFIWLIIDDGSTDNTKQLVEEWISEAIICIEYCYKQNGGMHTAHNLAYTKIKTELNVCIDSDDFMPSNAIENIIDFWSENGCDEFAGIIALNADLNNNLIGTSMPISIKRATLSEIYHKYHCKGDKKLIYRTDVITSVPEYPVFSGEKYVAMGYKYIVVDTIKPLLVMNKIVCNVDYQVDGLTSQMFKQYLASPRGFAEMRKQTMKYSPYLIIRFKNAIHYVSHSITLKDKLFILKSPAKVLTIFAIPFGLVWHLYVLLKNSQNKN